MTRLEPHGNKDELGNTTNSGDTGKHGGGLSVGLFLDFTVGTEYRVTARDIKVTSHPCFCTTMSTFLRQATNAVCYSIYHGTCSFTKLYYRLVMLRALGPSPQLAYPARVSLISTRSRIISEYTRRPRPGFVSQPDKSVQARTCCESFCAQKSLISSPKAGQGRTRRSCQGLLSTTLPRRTSTPFRPCC